MEDDPKTRPEGLIHRIELVQAQLHDLSEDLGVCIETARRGGWREARSRLLISRRCLTSATRETARAVSDLKAGTTPIEEGIPRRRRG